MTTTQTEGRVRFQFKIHWHVVFTHFPVSLFVMAVLFKLLHFIVQQECFEVAADVTLVVGVAALVPTLITGWTTWKGRYKGAAVLLFRRKIVIGFVMLGIGMILAVWRLVAGTVSLTSHLDQHIGFFSGLVLLMIGSFFEGYYGNRLNHR